MIMRKGLVPDHWTWRDGQPTVTGWRVAEKRKAKAEQENIPTGRGAVREARRPRPTQGSLL